MRIEDVIDDKNKADKINLDGIFVPVPDLRNLMKDGYMHLKLSGESNALLLWGDTCSACLTQAQILARGNKFFSYNAN